jgi:transcriptional regulator with XRE-family HTH domain
MKTLVTASTEHKSIVLGKALLRAVDALGLNQANLAEIVGMSESFISRIRSGGAHFTPGTKGWELAALTIRLYRGLDAICGGDARSAQAWMRNHNKDLNGTPAELIRHVTGLVDTVAYVDSHRARI